MIPQPISRSKRLTLIIGSVVVILITFPLIEQGSHLSYKLVVGALLVVLGLVAATNLLRKDKRAWSELSPEEQRQYWIRHRREMEVENNWNIRANRENLREIAQHLRNG